MKARFPQAEGVYGIFSRIRCMAWRRRRLFTALPVPLSWASTRSCASSGIISRASMPCRRSKTARWRRLWTGKTSLQHPAAKESLLCRPSVGRDGFADFLCGDHGGGADSGGSPAGAVDFGAGPHPVGDSGSRLSRQITKPINSLDLENPRLDETYEELFPLVSRLREQNRTIGRQMDAWAAGSGSLPPWRRT